MFTIIHRFDIIITSGTRIRAGSSSVHMTICFPNFKEFYFAG